MTAAGDPWWPFGTPDPAAPVRLFCLPHAGGGASAYGRWRRAGGLPFQVCPIQLPGREGRIREAPFRSLDALAEALVEVVRPWLGAPWALFGYSMGALVAFELAHRLAAAGLPPPRVLFVAASAAPGRRNRAHPLHALPDPEFRRALRELDGTPEAVLEHEELMELVLPLLRADFELTETYDPPPRAPLAAPVVAFGGAADPGVPRDALEAWGSLTAGGFRSVVLPAGHFFLESRSDDLLREVAAALEAPHAARPGA